MISASAIKGVKLKSTDSESKSDRSAPNLTFGDQEDTREKEETRRDYFFSTGLDRWYETLKEETFKTEFVEITPDEARAIVSFWQEHYQHKPSDAALLHESQIIIPDPLKELTQRLSTIISTLSPDKGAFVKLSTRSPKDSHVAFAKARTAYDSRVSRLSPNPSGNDKLTLLAEVVIESLRVRNGAEAIKRFVSSDRVGEDLEYALEPGDVDLSKRISIVIREWVEIPLWAEFRGFVWDGKMTSIGQYNHPVMFPKLKEQAATIQVELEAFFSSVQPHIPLDRYIVDFAWTKERVYLVEVNPFDGEIVFPASTGLWSWEKDREQMMRGPLELRIRDKEQTSHQLKSTTDPKWRAVIFD